MTRSRFVMTAAAVLVAVCAGWLVAAEPQTTAVYVDDMHCPACAKKIVTKLQTVEGVASVNADVGAGQAIVTPNGKAKLSPRALWEAVETAGYTPTKLVGPSGAFTEKPKS
jgi:copper chaperone CopZ